MCFGIKVWAVADALFKYLWNFEVYYGKSTTLLEEEDESSIGDGDDGYQRWNVVKDFCFRIWHVGATL